MLTTRGRYAVMAVVDMATRQKEENAPIKLAEIAEAQNISLNYLEQIYNKLKNASIVTSIKGPGGGYVFNDTLEEVKVLDVVEAVDESLKMTRCNPNSNFGCMPGGAKCLTHDLWENMGKELKGYLAKVSISDVVNKNIEVV
jgi:Rrf2 family iron-sulfur cluster assembly transcriptional regulator